MRPSKESYYMEIAHTVAKRATCDRAHVGAILVKGSQIVSTGYNGAPAGQPHCGNDNHEMEGGHCVRTVHAEVNVVAQAAKHGIGTDGATLYVTHKPCYSCSKILVNAGVLQVYFSVDYRNDQRVDNLFAESFGSCNKIKEDS